MPPLKRSEMETWPLNKEPWQQWKLHCYELTHRVCYGPVCTPDADRAVLWTVPCDADRGSGAVPHSARATAGGGPGGIRLADGVCPTRGRPSRAVSHLWPA